MNVSMQDAFNLGWKLAAVLEGRSDPALLATYSAERQPVARELIDFDREWSAMLAAPPRDPEHPGRGGVDPDELQDYFVRQGRYTAGVATRYGPSELIGHADHAKLASGFEIGARFHSAPVIRVGDARSMQLGHVARADGRWRLYVFSDRQRRTTRRPMCLARRGPELAAAALHTAGRRHRRRDRRPRDPAGHTPRCRAGRAPALLLPRKGTLGLIDYEKVFCADPPTGTRHLRRARGSTGNVGCVVIVRPDQFAAHVLPLDARAAITAFFEPILLAPAVAYP